jgi:hypothetical protein
MQSKRAFWIGLGIGMMAGALLLQLMNAGQAQTSSWAGMEPGTSENKETGSAVYTQEEADLLVQAAVAKAKQEVAGQPAAPEGGSNTEGADKAAAPEAGSKPESAVNSIAPSSSPSPKQEESSSGSGANVNGGKTTIVRIPPNSDLTSVGLLLQKDGIVKDSDTFVAYMQKDGSSGTVRAGYFSFTGSLELADIKNIVTGQPMDPEEAKKQMSAGK